MNFIDKIMAGGFLAGQKTYVTAIVAIITAISLYLTGDIALGAAVTTVTTAAMGAFLKAGQARQEAVQTLQVANTAGQLSAETLGKVVLDNKVSVTDAATAAVTEANK